MSIKALTVTFFIMAVTLSMAEGMTALSSSTREPAITHKVFYYLDYAYVLSTNNKTTGYFESPINYSDGTLNQSVYLIRFGGNVTVVNYETPYEIEISNESRGFIALKVVQEYRNSTELLEQILSNPQSFSKAFENIPSEIAGKYLLKPLEIINEYVKPAFEKWLSSEGYFVSNISKAFLAVKAAQFIYGQYFIKYNASAIPRAIDYVVKHRTGDCDDMSRVLLNILWSYDIPGKIEYSYVYLTYNATFNVEGSYLTFINAGPHAYVLMYIPTLGWVSLDFLAGALIKYPSIISGETTDTNVTSREVIQMREELSRYRYAEVTALYEAKDLPLNISKAIKSGTIEQYLFNLVKPSIAALKASLNAYTSSTTESSQQTSSQTLTSSPITKTATTTTTTKAKNTSAATPSTTSPVVTQATNTTTHGKPYQKSTVKNATTTAAGSHYLSTSKELSNKPLEKHVDLTLLLISIFSLGAVSLAIALLRRR